MRKIRTFRTKPTYAIWASVFVSMIYWIAVFFLELSEREERRPLSFWLGVFLLAIFTQTIGYCIFERRYKGTSLLAYNVIFFASTIVTGIAGMRVAIMVLTAVLISLLGMIPLDVGFLVAVYGVILYAAHFYILLIRIMAALLCQWVIGKGKNGWLRTAGVVGSLLILVFFLHRVSNIINIFREAYGTESEYSVSYSGQSDNTVPYEWRYALNNSGGNGTEKGSGMTESDPGDSGGNGTGEGSGMTESDPGDSSGNGTGEGSGVAELAPDIRINEEEYGLIVKLAEQIYEEEWEQMEVREWHAAEWICFQNEYRLKSIDLEGTEGLNGKLDLSRFRFLDTIRLAESDVEEVVFPEHLKDLEGYVFTGCRNLKKVTFGSKLKRVSTDSFYWCTKVEELVFQGDAPAVTGWISAWAEADIYYPGGKKGWNGDYWEKYHMIPD